MNKTTIKDMHEALKKGDLKVADLVQSYLDIITEKDGAIHAYLEVYDDVMAQAEAAQKMFADGTATMLTGIPIALKDNMLMKGKIASAGSKILGNYHAAYDGTVVEILKKAGAVLVGRTNMDEFAMGSSTENSAYGVTKNPIDTSRVPGGSSGGSSAAVAMGSVPIALGSDTGGSICQPASFCGVVGIKPTYGAVSRYGLVAMGNSLDQIGPFSHTVADAEIVCEAISTYDPKDSTSVPIEKRKEIAARYPRQGTGDKFTIGVPWHLFEGEGVDPVVCDNFKRSIERLADEGHTIVDITLPLARYALAVYYILMPAEVSTNLSRFDGIRYGHSADGTNLYDVYAKSRGEGFGPETRRRLLLGAYVLSHGYYDAFYEKAISVRTMIKKEFDNAFAKVDVIATPTSPYPAFKIGEKAGDPLAMYLSDIFTVPANIAGVPAISIPNGTTTEGLPLDMHFMAPHFCEDRLFILGKNFESLI